MSRFWLMKCEPAAYTIDDLARDKRTSWEGVRNYQARNFMRDRMQVGDAVHVDVDLSGVPFGGDFPFASRPGDRRMTGWL